MKKILFSAAILATNFVFGQITLEHTFTTNEDLFAFAKGNEMFYIGETIDNKLKIYNSTFNLIKIVNVPLPTNFQLSFWYDSEEESYTVSKHIFNTDDLLEFLVVAGYYNGTSEQRKLLLINENGILIKDFHPNSNYGEEFEVFHDSVSNTNKIIVQSWENGNYQSAFSQVYSLPTSALTLKEIQPKGKLSAFPIPTNKMLNVINPENGANKIEIFDTSGKLVVNKIFANTENKISIDVENLPKGNYIYKIGDLSSKFIKN